MARGPSPPSKGRQQQKLQQQIARDIRGPRNRIRTLNPAHHNWLVRHMERQNDRCAYCGIPMLLKTSHARQFERQATLDHVVALAHGGADSEANTVAACEPCNTEKADMTAQAFRMSEFLTARKAHAAKINAKKPLVIEKVRKRERPKPPQE